MAQTDVLRRGERRDLARGRPALRDDRDLPLDERHGHHSRPRRGAIDDVDEAEAVRPETHDVELAAQLDELALHAHAVAADLAEAGREHDSERNTGGSRVGERVGKPIRADEHEREIDGLADLAAARHRLPAVHDAAVSVHEMERPVEAELLEVDERAGRPAGPIGCAHDRDAPRCEERPQPLGARLGGRYDVTHQSPGRASGRFRGLRARRNPRERIPTLAPTNPSTPASAFRRTPSAPRRSPARRGAARACRRRARVPRRH